MNKDEARRILLEHLARYKQRSYSELALLVAAKQEDIFEVAGPTGTTYQLEFQFFWDSHPDGDIRVIGSIDDGGWRAFSPLTEDFVISPEGKFIGE